MRLRLRDGGLKEAELGQRVGDFLKHAEGIVPFIDEDAPLDKTLRALCAGLAAAHWSGPLADI